MIGTTEGLYITKDKIQTTLEKSTTSLDTKNHLTISDFNYKNFNLFTIITKLNKADNERICELNKQLLRLYEKRANEFYIIKNKHLEPIIVYNLEGEVLETKCIDINKINIHELTTGCFYNAQVSIITEKRLITAYLGHDGILSEYPIQRNCSLNRRILLPNSKSYIKLINNQVFKAQANNEESIIFHENIKEIKMDHISEIISTYNSKTISIEGLHANTNNKISKVIKYVEEKYNGTKKILITLCVIISILILIYILSKSYMFWKPISSDYQNTIRYNIANEGTQILPSTTQLNTSQQLRAKSVSPSNIFPKLVTTAPSSNIDQDEFEQRELYKAIKNAEQDLVRGLLSEDENNTTLQ